MYSFHKSSKSVIFIYNIIYKAILTVCDGRCACVRACVRMHIY